MPSIDSACEWMRRACEDWSVGYDQSNRQAVYDGGETDCSALVLWALRKAGFDIGSATYTGDMSANLTKRGWTRIPFKGLWQLQKGDILLNDACHTAMVISGSGATAKLAQASIDERGRATGGRAGDQTGGETNVRTVYVYSRGWDCILRYAGPSGALPVTGKLGKADVAEWQRQCGTTVDGVVTGQRAEYKSLWPALESIADYDGSGSALMEAVQTKVGVSNPTGVIARGTICMVQGWLVLHGHDIGDAKAGVLDTPTAKAVQESLNDGEWSL